MVVLVFQIQEKDDFNVSIGHLGVGAVGTVNKTRWPDGE